MARRSTWLVSLAAALVMLAISPAVDARTFLDSASEADKAILHDLYNGQIIEARRFGAQENTGSLWKVTIKHNGTIRQAVFKPRELGDRGGWARTPMEVGMYKLNRILGMNMVPPTAYRRNLNLNGQHFAEGALMVWVDDAHPIQSVDKNLWKPRHEPFASDLRILQMLGRDADHENPKNIIRGKHWRDGTYRVLKVDNEASMRQGAHLELDYNSAIWGKVTRFNPETYQRLKELNFNDLKGDMGEQVSDGEIREILKIRDRLVAHIDQQVRERGRDGVFFSVEEVGFNADRNAARKAKGKDVNKFEKLMKRKGVKVSYVKKGDPSLKGGVARTILAKDGSITVKIARGKGVTVRMGTLVEELVHVNQLRRMGRQVGGLKALHKELRKDTPKARALKASMETYAKGKVKTTARDDKEKRSITKEQRKQKAQVAKNAGIRSGTSTLWSKAFKSGGKKGQVKVKTKRAKVKRAKVKRAKVKRAKVKRAKVKTKTVVKVRPRAKVRPRQPERVHTTR